MNENAAITRRMRPLLGTYVEVGALRGESATDGVVAIEAAFTAIAQVQASLSFQDADSELSRLNQANGAALKLSSLALHVLRLARAMTHASNGRFNCTVGGALVMRARLPRHGDQSFLPIGNADDIVIHAGHAQLRRPVLITLDGIAKGFAVDLAVCALRRQGVAAGWVNAGGDLRAFGECVVPLQLRGDAAARFGVSNAAVATSVSAEHYDSDTPSELISTEHSRCVIGRWSVLAASAWRADALTKVAACAAPSERDALLHRLGGRWVSLDSQRPQPQQWAA